MRLNQFLARFTGISRRAADAAITAQRVKVNDRPAQLGQNVSPNDKVTLDDQLINQTLETFTIMLNKPVGYVCSREGQGGKTIYDLLPEQYHPLKPVGRLDKDSSGLLLLTNDGKLAHELTHPSFQKVKTYKVELNKSLAESDRQKIMQGVMLEDGLSRLKLSVADSKLLTIQMHEGRNRQIRRTFEALGYEIIRLHRIELGKYTLNDLPPGKFDLLKI